MKICILCTQSKSSFRLYNYLNDGNAIIKVIIENEVSQMDFIKYRIKRLGLWTVINQLIFQLSINKWLAIISQSRIAKIEKKYNLDSSQIPKSIITYISNVNSNESLSVINEFSPDVVIINGTRIISKNTLNAIKVPVLNIHAGITPKYRGVHGGYWALTNQDYSNFGVTLHYVDAGVDTGIIISQTTIPAFVNDNFYTYPVLQQAFGLELLKKHLNSGELYNFKNNLQVKNKVSKQWFHPTIWQYLYYLFYYGVK